MHITNIDDERIDEVLDGWDELLDGTEDFALWGGGSFDQDLFREIMYKTWKLFSERIDFDAPDEEYALPIDYAVILGKIMAYGRKLQITYREDGGDVTVSAMLAADLGNSIRYRYDFPKDVPVISSMHHINNQFYRLKYDLESGELHLQKGLGADAPPSYFFDITTGEIQELEQENQDTGNPIIVTDISRWSFDCWQMPCSKTHL